MTILEKLRQYDPYGPKCPVATYSIGNKLLAFFESVDKEAIRKYSYALGRILDFMIISNNILLFFLNMLIIFSKKFSFKCEKTRYFKTKRH